MSYNRIATKAVSTAVLGEPITFRHGKKAINRIMKSPLSEKMYNWDQHREDRLGIPTEEIINLYSHWGHGGFGLIVTGNLAVDPKYVGEAGQGIISTENSNEESRKLLIKLANSIKSCGALAIAQTNHIGKRAIPGYTNSRGERHNMNKPENPLDFSIKQLEERIIKRFAHAAKILYQSGFDGIELHCAHGMIFNQFLAFDNKRNDEYGGSIENRARLLTGTYEAIRKEVPEITGFLIGAKLNSTDFQESGISREEIIRVCELIENTGFDFVELTGGAMESAVEEEHKRQTTIDRENFFRYFIQQTSNIFQQATVYITGRWQTANAMVTAVNMGWTKGIGLGRWSCSEPDFPRKLIAGDIFSCLDTKFAPSEFGTSQNAAHFQMKQLSKTPFDSRKSSFHLITDFTVEEEALNFKKAVLVYDSELELIGGKNQQASVISYVPLQKYK